jgi:hypothetical protein
MVREEHELVFLENAKKSGVVYLLGGSEVIASKDSSFFKRFIVNYAYNILWRNCTQGQSCFRDLHKHLLQVGMTHYM